MREGLITLPRTVDTKYHGILSSKLVDAFGGFTAIESRGAWRDPKSGVIFDEPVVQYVVAYEPNFKNNEDLAEIAKWVLTATDELAVYLRFADGDVKIIDR